ncbi:GP88 family protein [Marinicauda sp. Alg238-R41]|uniref:GP88 family protein n=1 Tax=Marinicauda sp. Alg238-R41 TaxID=2993447 RepID=UPI0022E3A31F|nr:hypothetical protein [Marinicauda sp. Alg238-R41]
MTSTFPFWTDETLKRAIAAAARAWNLDPEFVRTAPSKPGKAGKPLASARRCVLLNAPDPKALAVELGWSKSEEAAYQSLLTARRAGLSHSQASKDVRAAVGESAAPDPVKRPAAQSIDLKSTTHRRFRGHKIEPGRYTGLADDHPAVVEGRPLFQNAVHASVSPRLLVDGKNSRKIGHVIGKGRWRGMKVFTLTLEERRTCPRSCEHWGDCYGNAMHWARRHIADPALESRLEAEVAEKAREHPQGFVVRLHVLGDFYNVGYVLLWCRLLKRHPQLRCFGYTAYDPRSSDQRERRIGFAVQAVREAFPDRFAIRLSGYETRVQDDFEDPGPRELICPAQLSEDASCGSCAWCWEREERIVFVRHGIKTSGPVKRAEPSPAEEAEAERGGETVITDQAAEPWTPERDETLRIMRENDCDAATISSALGGTTRRAVIKRIHDLGLDKPEPEAAKPSEPALLADPDTDLVAQWLEQNEPTQCPPGYAAGATPMEIQQGYAVSAPRPDKERSREIGRKRWAFERRQASS